MSPGQALLRVSGGGGAVAPGHVTTAAGAGVSAGGRPRPGARVLHPRSCGVLAATCHRYTRLIISTLGHVLNIYTMLHIIQVTWMVKPFTLLHNRY